MTPLTMAVRRPPVRGLAILMAMAAFAIGTQLAAVAPRPVPAPLVVAGGPALDNGLAGGDTPTADASGLDRIRADIAFWSDRVQRQPKDFVSATEWAAVEIEFARATGDLSAWDQAERATAQALDANPGYGAAVGYRGSVLLALHRFAEARDMARPILATRPNDPFALSTLGDASLDLGAYADARAAYAALDKVAHSAASLVRLGRLAYLDGHPEQAVSLTRQAASAADAEGSQGERLAWYRCQLGNLLASTGSPHEAEAVFAQALAVDPRSWLARVGLARIEASGGRIEAAIAHLSQAITIVPMPDTLARRSDLYELRGAAGDPKLAANDRATVEAIARLAGANGVVYDRTLALYLANHGLQADRAVAIAEKELALRTDVDGYDAYAWALLAAGRATDADRAMAKAVALGTRDARLLYHAGMIAAALHDGPRARELLTSALNLDATFDPLQVKRARETLANLP
jgi:tetratricopeptide (TPR) repeat protein